MDVESNTQVHLLAITSPEAFRLSASSAGNVASTKYSLECYHTVEKLFKAFLKTRVRRESLKKEARSSSFSRRILLDLVHRLLGSVQQVLAVLLAPLLQRLVTGAQGRLFLRRDLLVIRLTSRALQQRTIAACSFVSGGQIS